MNPAFQLYNSSAFLPSSYIACQVVLLDFKVFRNQYLSYITFQPSYLPAISLAQVDTLQIQVNGSSLDLRFLFSWMFCLMLVAFRYIYIYLLTTFELYNLSTLLPSSYITVQFVLPVCGDVSRYLDFSYITSALLSSSYITFQVVLLDLVDISMYLETTISVI